ncbi:MAG: hypothetical protein JO356_13395 [Acidobacteria bacterium]|nr:hypothetical protein [Acidobacteriota bacterium]
MCKSLRDMRSSILTPYRVSLLATSEPPGWAYPLGFGIAQYSPRTLEPLDAKIQQFLRGTTFMLRPALENDKFDIERIKSKVPQKFKRHGTILIGP